jgi:soluble lytic murein transglycosylase-like protein
MRRPEQALIECAALPSQSEDERLKIAHWQRQFGDTAAAARLLDELARGRPAIAGKTGYLFERYELARARGEKKAAQELLEGLANGPDSEDSGRAQILLYLQSADPAQQTAWLRRYIDNSAHGKDWAARTLGLAIDEFTAGHLDASLDWAQRLVRTGSPHDDLVHGALYLEARILEARKQPGAAEIYAGLSRDDRYGYYGMIARRRAGLPPLAAMPPLAAASPEFTPEPGAPAEAGDLLMIAGFPDWAADFYREAGPACRLKEALAVWLTRDYSRAASLARSRVLDSYSDEGDSLSRLEWQLIYPVAYPDAIGAGGGTADDPLLTLALIRQESFFRADVVSSAGAIGLMQLMPATAARVARQLNLSRDTDLLYDPGHNVQLGRRYFSDLLTAFGEPAFALAGYNAGPGRIPGWRQQIGASGDLDLFIERIPIQQTRSYVRRILLNWQEYRRIYTDWPGARAASLRLQTAPWSQPWPAPVTQVQVETPPGQGIRAAR